MISSLLLPALHSHAKGATAAALYVLYHLTQTS